LLADRGATADPERLRELCRFANAVAALATTGRGAIPAMPTADAVHQLLSSPPTR
jgi:fructokinase